MNTKQEGERILLHTCKLSKLSIKEEDHVSYLDNFNKIMELVNKLQDVNTESVEPYRQSNANYTQLRLDGKPECLSIETIKDVSPYLTPNNLLEVPIVIQEKS